MNKATFFALLMILGSAMVSEPVCGAPSANAETVETYKRWHEICLEGEVRQIDAQIKKFEARLVQNPKDELARAFLGSACALRAKAGIWGPTKLKFLKRGKELMNAAVANAPHDPRVRMVRAIAYYRVPERFKVRATSLADFEVLIPIAENPQGRLKLNERQVILYYASLAYAEEEKPGAAKLKVLCHDLDPDSPYGQLTKK